MLLRIHLAPFQTICIVCTHIVQSDSCSHCFSLVGYFRWVLFESFWASVDSASLHTCTDLVPLATVWKSLERPDTCAIKQQWPFSHQSSCVSLLPFFVFPFSSPQGGVAFTASNYRLYQSYISPYISVDLSRHLKGQLIALWQACAWPLKEKSRSGRSNPHIQHVHIQTQTHTHIHDFVPVCSGCPFCLLYRFNLVSLVPAGIPFTRVSSHFLFEGTKRHKTHFRIPVFCVCAQDTNDEG